MTDPTTLPPLPLPQGITSRYIDTFPSSLKFHILESFPSRSSTSSTTPAPLVLLIHGFPELAYSWRHILPRLSAQGFHAVALDQRGFGRTHSASLEALPPPSFRPLNLIRDVVTLTHALGYDRVRCIVGHDFGAVTASLCALARPDLFESVVLMSHPTKGPPSLPFATHPHPAWGVQSASALSKPTDMEADLAALDPPQKHYKWYYCTAPANHEMTYPTGTPLHEFLRGYFHLKSADWPGNSRPAPHQLQGWKATELAKMPRYYIMDRDSTMREGVANDMRDQDPEDVRAKSARWLSDPELDVYVSEYTRTEFQGGLNWYKIQTQPGMVEEMQIFAGRRIEVPCAFVAGREDWGTYQEPGAVEAMEQGKSVREDCWRGVSIVDGAGHWVNQEQPEKCVELILEVIGRLEGDV